MAHGVPALVSGYTAQPEVVMDSGFVIREISAEGIAHELERFLEMSVEQREAQRNKVRAVVEQFHLFDHRLKSFQNILCDDGV